MINKCFWGVSITVLLVLALSLSMFGQGNTAIYGNLSGVITDSTGAVVPGAKVTAGGPTGNKSVTSEQDGRFSLVNLTPGTYSVKVEKQGFRAAEVKGIEIVINRTSSVTIGLQPGSVSEVVEVSAAAVTVDTTSTAVGTNLSDNFYQAVPVARNVAGLFYASPGVANSGGAGTANPSISGGSGLENLYVADGVDITDTSFGGLGTYNRNYGSLGTGINLSFIKEVQVKTGGYEPQYGKSTGGIVQIVTKSGSNAYHGALTGFFAPQEFEAERLHADNYGRTNLLGQRVHQGAFDASGEFGGYVPGFKDKIFFFGSFNPVWNRSYDLTPSIFALSALGPMTQRTNTYNYSVKGTVHLSDKHSVEASFFGDPAHTGLQANRGAGLIADNSSAWTKLDFGSRNLTAHYNGTLTPTWLLNFGFSWMHNSFTENTFDTFNGGPNFGIADYTQSAGLTGQRGIYNLQGPGFIEDTKSDNYGIDVNTSKVAHLGGEHTLGIGYKMEMPRYDPHKFRSGGRFAIPTTNATGGSYLSSSQSYVAGNSTDAQFRLRLGPGVDLVNGVYTSSCDLCPVMMVPGAPVPVAVDLQQIRGEFGPADIHTEGSYQAAFVNDSWTLNKHVTLNLGYRWEQQHMKGDTLAYTFTDNWSPRFGIALDPKGDRKTKIYANFGRYDYAIPLDLAERSLSNELDYTGARWAPAFTVINGVPTVTVGANGGVTVVPDAAHLLSKAACAGGPCFGGVSTSSQGTFAGTGIASGTKMQYLDEFVVGGEREIWGGAVLSVRYMDRRLKRIVEDTGGISPEAANGGVSQTFIIANVTAQQDLFTNPIAHNFTPGGTPPAACDSSLVLDPVTDTFGNSLGAVCFETNGKNGQPAGVDIPDGVPDGFPNPVRNYQAVEVEVNKSFSKNWLMRANWRIAKLYGNFEGAFRNDNGQSDPSISSLYDFTAGTFGLLGDQFKPGYLNTDRRHIVNGFFSYVFDKTALKGLTLGTGINVQSGVPINDLKAHPVYLNAGEVPVGGRGALGRTKVLGQVDAHIEYAHALTEKFRLRLGADLFNIANSKTLQMIDQNEDTQFGVANVDFLKPNNLVGRDSAFQRPFYGRFMVKFEF
jgi:hypothetical protein